MTGRQQNKTYNGLACKKCGGSERYISSGGCAACARQKAMEYATRFPDKVKESRRRGHLNNLDRHRNYKLLYSYGISLEQYNAMMESQGGVCLICKDTCSSGRRLCVDHDHKTNTVRGLLCVNCNRAIGNMRDDPTLLRRAAAYLTGGLKTDGNN